jgi:hypothetical protein
VLVTSACAVALAVSVTAQQKTPFPIPDPKNPQITTLEDQYIRVAYNNEGYVIMGYRLTQELVGKEWVRIEMGTTVREGRPRYALKREHITLDTPDNQHLSLPTNPEFRQVDMRAVENQARVINDSINYFPPTVRGSQALLFFAESDGGQVSYNEVEVDPTRAVVGRLFFKIPGGLKLGQHFLNVQFASSKIRVPFRIFTKEETKIIQKNWKDIKKQVEEAFKKKGK